VIHPVDRSRWDDVTALFGPSGIARGCWCMERRISYAESRANGNAGNRAALAALADEGEPVGVIGYLEDVPVAWCAIAPRPAYRVVRSRTLPIDDPEDPSIWALTCLYVKTGHRKQGLTSPMIDGAVEHAQASGARIVEAYPVAVMPGDVSSGKLEVFLEAGFEVYEKERTTSKRNVVVRRVLRDDEQSA
ncbi:MAG TPA: GNAT family N-acetyltransferase, partial [Actinopolymorphaceae bacterium]